MISLNIPSTVQLISILFDYQSILLNRKIILISVSALILTRSQDAWIIDCYRTEKCSGLCHLSSVVPHVPEVFSIVVFIQFFHCECWLKIKQKFLMYSCSNNFFWKLTKCLSSSASMPPSRNMSPDTDSNDEAYLA